MISVSKRLQAIIEWIDGDIMADIGCDHAYVAMEAIKQNKVKKAFACDIAQGPLQNAKKTIEAAGLQDKIECLLMDGIRDLSSKVGLVVIAGMGSKTIESILEQGDLENRTFLLMPHKDAEDLRLHCSKNHLIIEKERMIHDGNHYYPLMKVHYDRHNKQEFEPEEIFYGKNMIFDAVYIDYLHKEQKKWNQIDKKMPDGKNQATRKRLDSIGRVLKKINPST